MPGNYGWRLYAEFMEENEAAAKSPRTKQKQRLSPFTSRVSSDLDNHNESSRKELTSECHCSCPCRNSKKARQVAQQENEGLNTKKKGKKKKKKVKSSKKKGRKS